MSARDWLYARLTGALIDPERVQMELDAYRDEVARELAEKIRASLKSWEGMSAYVQAANGGKSAAADLIDPEVSDG